MGTITLLNIFRYKKFKGKIFQLPKFNPLKKKYGGFKIDVNLFNKKLVCNPLTKKIHNHTRQMKKKLFSHFKKYQEEDKKEEEQKWKTILIIINSHYIN